MIAFIDEHRAAYGVEPICRVLPIAPSHLPCPCGKARRSGRSVRRGQCAMRRLKADIRRVWEENFQVYGVRKVWRQLRREGHRGGALHGGALDEADGPARRRCAASR